MKLKKRFAPQRRPARDERRLPPPDDYCAELLARGDRTGAIRYCKEMYTKA